MVSISNLVIRGNEAIKVNPPGANVDIHLTAHGSDWLWAVFSVFSLLFVVQAVLYFLTPRNKFSLKRFLNTMPIFTTVFLAYAYFTYASNLGWASAPTEFHHVTTSEDLGERQIFYAKFIGWFCAYPFVILAIEVATNNIELESDTSAEFYSKLFGLLSNYVAKVLAIEVFTVSYLIGPLIQSTYKWGYFAFGTLGLVATCGLVLSSLLKSWNSSTRKPIATILILLQACIWILYPIAWGVSEGGNKIQPDSEAVFYGIIDLFTFGVIPFGLTLANIKGLDDTFFHKLVHPKHEKEMVDSPRASGETAVPPSV